MDPRVSPLRIKSVGGGGIPIGSFFTLPVRLLDQENHVIGVTPGESSFKFLQEPGGFPDGRNRLRGMDNTATFNLVPDQDQWKTDRNTPPTYSIRFTAVEGTGTPHTPQSTINVWRTLEATVYGTFRPASGMRFLIFTIEIAETADLLAIKARAFLTARYTRA